MNDLISWKCFYFSEFYMLNVFACFKHILKTNACFDVTVLLDINIVQQLSR